MGLLCSCKKIPYYANVQGLGTAFQKPVLAGFVTVLYRIAFRKVKYVFFENKENAREFGERNIVSADRQVVLPGAGINLEKYKMEPYPNHSRVHFLYLGRIMKEKGIHEGCIEQIQRLYSERLYSNEGIATDDKGRIRIDDWEMREDVQELVAKLWPEATTENLAEIGDLAGYRHDFYNLFGFEFDGVNYQAEANELVNVPSIV